MKERKFRYWRETASRMPVNVRQAKVGIFSCDLVFTECVFLRVNSTHWVRFSLDTGMALPVTSETMSLTLGIEALWDQGAVPPCRHLPGSAHRGDRKSVV